MTSFADTFLTARPRDGIDIVHERSRAGKTLDEELAQYFKERAAIEDQYAKSLVKASKRLYVMDKSSLGNFAPVWDLLVNEFTEVSTIHAVFSYKIAEEIEKPLKTQASAEYNEIGKIEPTMQKLARDFDENEKKTKKTGEKGNLFKRSTKNGTAKRARDDAATNWRTQGPRYLELHQAAEEARLNRLKSMVEKFEQMQSEQMLQRIEFANVVMSAATAFDVQNEITQFCQERGSKLARVSRGPDEARRGSVDSRQDSILAPSERSFSQPTGRPEKRSSRVMSAFSLRRKNRNASATKLPDNFETIEEVPTEQAVSSPVTSNIEESTTAQKYEQQQQQQQQPSPSSANTPPQQSNFATSSFPVDQTSSKAPAVDAEGYSIPPPNRSLFTTALTESDADESMQGSQRFKIDIHDAAVKTDDDREADATFTRVSSLLRERTPSVARRPRGRRENIRSVQLEPGVLGYRGSPTLSNKDEIPVHANSSFSSRSTTPTNPFHYAAPTDLATPTSLYTTPSSASQSPALSHMQAIPEASQPQISSLITELVSRTPEYRGKTQVSGDIKILYNGPNITTEPLLLRVCNVNGALIPNGEYVEHWEGHPDVFALKPKSFDNVHQQQQQQQQQQQRRSAVTCFTYHQDSDNDALPLYMAPSWKCVEGASFLIVKYKFNDKILPQLSKSQLIVYAKFDQVPVTNVQSTPQGSWDPSKCVLTWTMDALLLQQQQQQQQQPLRLLAKFTTEGQGSPVPINLRYYYKDCLTSNVTLEAVPASGSTLQVSQIQKVVKSDDISFAERK